MDGLSEGETLSRNIWGRLSDTAVPSVVDDDNGLKSKVRRAQTMIADTSGLSRGAYRPGPDTRRSRRHHMSSLNNFDVFRLEGWSLD